MLMPASTASRFTFRLNDKNLSRNVRVTDTDWTLKLPQGVHVTSAPQPASVESPFGTVSVAVEQLPSAVHVKTTVTMKKTRIAASEYPAFRAWCENADRALGQRVALSR